MPWKVSGVVERRKQFIAEYESGEWTIQDLCRIYGISRQTGYVVLHSFQRGGWNALEERSRAPHRHPNQTPKRLEEIVLELRRAHMRWGPRKLKAVLERECGEVIWPAASTIGALIRREGLAVPRRVRRRTPPYTEPFQSATEPNRVWCADFKGWFRTGDGERIDPLTITDARSRYLLRCQAVEKTDTERVRAIFEAAFREYGLPWAIRTDNGAPFASRAIAGLSRLALFWMKLGITAERIDAGHPEQNGRHERMHRTLKAETAQPPQPDRRGQQKAFDEFRHEYNHERPHEALGQQTPASCYRASPREYPVRVPEPEYDSAMQVRRVRPRGQFTWKCDEVFLSETLIGERVGLERQDDRYWTVYFARFPIGRLDAKKLTVGPLPKCEAFGGDGIGDGIEENAD